MALYFFLAIILGACSKTEVSTPKRLFAGPCTVEVEAQGVRGAEIYVDSIHTGEDHIRVQVPCGEKLIEIKKEGYQTYHEYLPLSETQPLKVTWELKPAKGHIENFALSHTLIAQIKKGERPHDPTLPVKAGETFQLKEEEMPALALNSQAGASVQSDETSQSGEKVDLNSVEAWR